MDKAAIIEVLKKQFALDPQTARVLVAGLSRTGISSAHYLRDLGIKFAIIDSRAKPPLMEIFSRQMPDAAVFTGGFDEAAFKVATHLIVRSGVSHNEKAIIKATVNGARILSDTDLFACSAGVPVVANGSSGKRTLMTHQEEICHT
jgi:UDP-N-acetylmuramoylalanine--D-glutamate ligase